MKDQVAVVIACVVFAVVPAVGQTVIHVDDDAPPGGDGQSWLSAYSSLQDAIDDASTAGLAEIRVAGGTYIPTARSEPGVARTETFALLNGVAIRGGYRGLAPGGDSGDRDVVVFETTLSGNIGGIGGGDNAYHVVFGDAVDGTAVLDGFTVTAGNADGDYPWRFGGGMRNIAGSSPTVKDCVFVGNSAAVGGGMFNMNASNPTVVGCSFVDNFAPASSCGLANRGSSPVLINCVFSQNQGNAVTNEGGSPTFTNCVFMDNTGSAISNTASNPTVTNCTFHGNSGYGSRSQEHSFPVLVNCVLWGNGAVGDPQIYDVGGFEGSTTTATYSCIERGWPGTGNITSDPLLAPDCRLGGGSPCIDAGDNGSVPPDVSDLDGDGNATEPMPLDLAGLPRFVDDPSTPDTGIGSPPIVDMGAYEYNCVGGGASLDCNNNLIPDECEFDNDCNGNGVPDDCDVVAGSSVDCNDNVVPDECEMVDCNGNGILDSCDISSSVSDDCDGNGTPDECQTNTDCNGNGALDVCDILAGTSGDCNHNSNPDECDIASVHADDCNANNVPDSCDVRDGTSTDCNDNTIPDECDVMSGVSPDCDLNGVADECDVLWGVRPDCNGNGEPDKCDIGTVSSDTNLNGVPDECEIVLRVPGDAGTIQAALDSASDGAIVEVAPGTYTGPGNKNLDFQGKSVYLRCGGPAESCIIDCEDDGRGFRFESGEGRGTVVDGFVVQDGEVFYQEMPTYGGGLSIHGSSPTIRNCAIVSCVCINDIGTIYGGGVACTGGANPVFVSCRIDSNLATNTFYDGGIAKGGGVHSDSGSHPVFINTAITRNMVTSYGDPGPASARGGGLHTADATLMGCVIAENEAYVSPTSIGGDELGAAIYQISGNLVLINSTVAGNEASHWYFASVHANNAIIRNSIIWGNTPSQLVLSGQCLISYSDIMGGLAGILGSGTVTDDGGNVDLDPDFVDPTNGDYRLGLSSGAIDRGDNTAVPPDQFDLDEDGNIAEPWPLDLVGNVRFYDSIVPDTGVGTPPIVDMGAYENVDSSMDCNGNGIEDCYDQLGDFSGDGYVNGADMDAYLACLTAPCPMLNCGGALYADVCCALADSDDDGDVDLRDFAAWQAIFGKDCMVDGDCDDGLFCNGEETCESGVCASGGNPCEGDPQAPYCDETADTCVECLSDGDCADGVFCNGEESCTAGGCAAGTNPCIDPTLPYCDEAEDVCECQLDSDCDDGLFCTGVETCAGGVCVSSGDPCTGDPQAPYCEESSDSCIQCVPESVSLTWWSSRTDLQNVIQHNVEAFRHGSATTGYLEGTIFLPGSATWTLRFAIDPDNDADADRNDYVDFFINDVFEARYLNGPTGSSYFVDAVFVGDQLDYRFEFVSSTPLTQKHMLVWNGSATKLLGDCDDGLFCTGVEVCESGVCVSSGDPCTDPSYPICDEGGDACIGSSE